MNKKVSGITYWEQQRGKRSAIQLSRYQCVTGDSDFIVTGKKPKCPNCKGKKLDPVLEIEQLGLFSSKFNLVMRCKNVECNALIAFIYEIDYNESESE